MQYYSQTGRTKSDPIKITKSVGSLIISTDKGYQDLLNETITIEIERVNGSNVAIATKMRMLDFATLSNFGAKAILSNDLFQTVIICELTPNGAIALNEGETLNVLLESLNSSNTYQVNAIEEPFTSNDFYKFDRKTMSSDDVQKLYDVQSTDLVTFSDDPALAEVTVKFSNGMSIKYNRYEIQTVTRDIDPVHAIDQAGAVAISHPNRITLPTVGVDSIEFQKNTGVLLDISTRRVENLLNVQ